MLRGLQTLNNSAPAPQIRCADQGYDCQGCASQGGNCYNSQNMEQCCNDNGCTWDKASPQQCGSRHTPSQGGSVTGVDAARQCLQPGSDLRTAEVCCKSACNNDAQCIGHCQSIVSGQEPSPGSGPDGCPSAYFDQNMQPNFAGSCNNNSPGGYVDCCRCGGMSGGIGQCPSGCSDMGGDCVPSGGSPPSPPSLPQTRGCYSVDEGGNYFRMSENSADKCQPPNVWVNGNGGNQPQPTPPQPSPPQPSPSKDCTDDQVKSLQTGKCLTITKDTKWTEDVYNSMLADMVSETGLSKEVCTCALSNITKKYSPIETKNNNSAILNIIKDCSNRKIKSVTPQLYTSDDNSDTGKSDNTKKILLIVGIILLVLALLVLGGVMIHEHNKK